MIHVDHKNFLFVSQKNSDSGIGRYDPSYLDRDDVLFHRAEDSTPQPPRQQPPELDFSGLRGWDGGMKTLLTVLLLAASTLLAEEVVISKSAFGGGQGINGSVAALVVQPDGKIVLGGSFAAVNGVPRGNIARLNADGTLDETFAPNPFAGANGPVRALALRADGGIVVGGSFSEAGGVTTKNLALFKPDGTVDPAFASVGDPGTNGEVLAVSVQPDGKVVIGGSFTAVCGRQRNAIARINADGTLDENLPANGRVTGSVEALVATGPSSSLAGGSFFVTNQVARSLFSTGNP